MAKFLSTADVAITLKQIINEAVGNFFMVNPLLKIPRDCIEALQEARHRGVKLQILFSRARISLLDQQLLNLLGVANLYQTFPHPNRCCFNEQQMVIISQNPYQMLQRQAGISGLLVDSIKDFTHFQEVVADTYARIKQAKRVFLGDLLGLDGSEKSGVILPQKDAFQNS